MKLTLILYYSLLVTSISYSQTKKASVFNPETFPQLKMKLRAEKTDHKITLTFRELQVIDKRNDTSQIGFYIPSQYNRSKEGRLVTDKPLPQSIKEFADSQIEFNNTASPKLVMIVRKLWLSKEIENKEEGDLPAKMQRSLLSGIIAVFEFYAAEADTYKPLHRFDSIILHSYKKIELIDEELVKKALTAAIVSLSKSNYSSKLKNSKSFRKEEIDSFYKKAAEIKIMQEPVYQKGVYRTYTEFVNNSPSIKNFEIRKSSIAHTLYVKDDNGEEYPIRKIWGFSDGERLFIKSNDAYFLLEKHNNSFYAWASKRLSKRYNLFTPGAIGAGLIFLGTGMMLSAQDTKQNVMELKLYQLDQDSGTLY